MLFNPWVDKSVLTAFYYGTNAVHFHGSLIWNNLPTVVKSSDSVLEFKNKIKNIGDIDCGYLICRNIYYMMFYFILWYSWNLLAKAILCTNGK